MSIFPRIILQRKSNLFCIELTLIWAIVTRLAFFCFIFFKFLNTLVCEFCSKFSASWVLLFTLEIQSSRHEFTVSFLALFVLSQLVLELLYILQFTSHYALKISKNSKLEYLNLSYLDGVYCYSNDALHENYVVPSEK